MWTCPASGLLHTRTHTHAHKTVPFNGVFRNFFLVFLYQSLSSFISLFVSFFFMHSFLLSSFSYIRFSFLFPFLFLSLYFCQSSGTHNLATRRSGRSNVTSWCVIFYKWLYNSQIRISNPDEECDVWTWATRQTASCAGDCTTGYKLVRELV